jgi:hypothetical protein
MSGEARVRTVVLVEDHALTRAGLKTALDAAGDLRVVAEADDGPSGLAAIERHQPDVAVVDLGLPGLDGIEVTRRARLVAPRTPIRSRPRRRIGSSRRFVRRRKAARTSIRVSRTSCSGASRRAPVRARTRTSRRSRPAKRKFFA